MEEVDTRPQTSEEGETDEASDDLPPMGGQAFFCSYQEINVDDADPQRCQHDEDEEESSIDRMNPVGDGSEQGFVLNATGIFSGAADVIFLGWAHVAVQSGKGM